ncbi:unnamed protein product [Ranitomeya imitator]|uniref:JmjC domain-containing protein n=1 Tax=Ranitomeya imitator TaxID=111125 RepID=A0ABN9LIE8_9NEOB|nr:unnamed protein product [Ranitomeya imitator]
MASVPLRYLLLQVIVALSLQERSDYTACDGGGWQRNNYSPVQEEERCTVERRDASITYSEFIERGCPFPGLRLSPPRPPGPGLSGCGMGVSVSEIRPSSVHPAWHGRAYSFGIAGSGTGVPFHWHGPGYSEVIYGRKRWFLYPPDKTPEFNPNRTTLSWMLETYPLLPAAERPIECTIRPGEVLYFPDRWWHATLNLDTSVFISTFLG